MARKVREYIQWKPINPNTFLTTVFPNTQHIQLHRSTLTPQKNCQTLGACPTHHLILRGSFTFLKGHEVYLIGHQCESLIQQHYKPVLDFNYSHPQTL